MSNQTTLLKSKVLNLHIWCSGSMVDPYANIWYSKIEPIRYNPTNYKALNVRYERVMLGSGKKVWRWSNWTPNWLKNWLSFRYELKHRNAWNFTGEYTEDGQMIMEPEVTVWQFTKQYIKRYFFCNHENMEMWDDGDAENGPNPHVFCSSCGRAW